MIDCSYISHFNICILTAQCLFKGVLKRDKKIFKANTHCSSEIRRYFVLYTAVVRSSSWLLARFSLHMTVM